MAPIKALLVTSDLTVQAESAIRTGAALARTVGAELHVFHCLPARGGGHGRPSLAQAEDQLRLQIDRIVTEPADPPRIAVAAGAPAEQINRRAAEVGAGLVILGPHKPRSHLGPFTTTTADKVIRSSPIPCLVATRPLVRPLRRVTVATDFSSAGFRALEQGLEWVAAVVEQQANDQVTVVEIIHVVPFGSPVYRNPNPQAQLARMTLAARKQLRNSQRVKVLPRMLAAPMVEDGIRRAADEMNSDLVVVGTRGHGPLGKAFLGSVASALVRELPRSILLVPPR